MSEKIYPKIINGQTYYYLQSTYREKINPADKGKNRGSGKSKVKTKNIYLGSASAIKKKLLTLKDPLFLETSKQFFSHLLFLQFQLQFLLHLFPGSCLLFLPL